MRLRAIESVAQTKELVKEVRKIVNEKRTPRAADIDAHRNFNDKLDSYMLVMVVNNGKKV